MAMTNMWTNYTLLVVNMTAKNSSTNQQWQCCGWIINVHDDDDPPVNESMDRKCEMTKHTLRPPTLPMFWIRRAVASRCSMKMNEASLKWTLSDSIRLLKMCKNLIDDSELEMSLRGIDICYSEGPKAGCLSNHDAKLQSILSKDKSLLNLAKVMNFRNLMNLVL